MTKKKRRGAPVGNKNAKKKRPMVSTSIRARPEQLSNWLDEAERRDMEFSDWVRWALDSAI